MEQLHLLIGIIIAWPEASSISRHKNNSACVCLALIVVSELQIFY